MTVLYYYLFLNKDISKSIRENILYSESVWKVPANIIYCSITFIVIPLFCSELLLYLNNWISTSLVGSGMIENKVLKFMLACFPIISVIDIVGLFAIAISGTLFLVFYADIDDIDIEQ